VKKKINSVTVGLAGGLGNQLFQYAAGRSLSLALGSDLEIVHSRFLEDRNYDLENFDLPTNIKVIGNTSRLPRCFTSAVNRLIKKFFTTNKGLPIYRESHFCYDPNFQEISSPVFLEGYFQSEKYFKAYAEIIRYDLVSPRGYPARCLPVLERIGEYDAIAIHIRRGDYISVKKNVSVYHNLSIEYYQNAVSLISKGLKNPRCFVFSDDHDWVIRNISLEIPWEVININSPKEAFWDLALMRRCKHFVIANSSFSWWGAWLGNDPNKIVVTPKKWFKDGSIKSEDLIPEGWLKL